MKEATARIKINKLFEAAGWRFFPEGNAPANIRLEPGVSIKTSDLDAFGNNFEKPSKGYVDFLLLDGKGFPFIVLEAKAEDKDPLIGKEQARKYARSQNCRFVILSNGNLHHFWDLDRGNPYIITSFPTPDSVIGYQKVKPDPQRFVEQDVREDYIVLTQRPIYASEAGWKNEAERPAYIRANKLRFLRPCQLKAIHALQRAVKENRDDWRRAEIVVTTVQSLLVGNKYQHLCALVPMVWYKRQEVCFRARRIGSAFRTSCRPNRALGGISVVMRFEAHKGTSQHQPGANRPLREEDPSDAGPCVGRGPAYASEGIAERRSGRGAV